MRLKPEDYLTFYRHPDEAPAIERLRVRLACQVMLEIDSRCNFELLQSFFSVAQQLLLWSRPVLQGLSQSPLRKCLLKTRLQCENDSLDAAELLNEKCEPEWTILPSLQRRRDLRGRWIRETLNWVTAAKESNKSPVERNVEFLAESLGLSNAEKALATCVAVARSDEAFLSIVREIRCNSLSAAAHKLASILNVPSAEMLKALHPSATLTRLGMVNTEAFSDLEDILRVSENRIYSKVDQPFDDIRHFLSSFLKAAAPATIQIDDIAHLRVEFDNVTRVISQALVQKERGVNVLLYGDAGAGKTEFARLIARELKVQLFEVDYEDDEGGSATGKDRLSALLLATRALSNRRDAVILLDEAEDVFPFDVHAMFFPGSRSRGPYAKAWMNRMLEGLSMPVIWISNDIDSMDPAYLRRFLLHVRFQELPTPAKQRLTERYLGDLPVGNEFKGELARLERLTPAQLESASRVARLCGSDDANTAEDLIRFQLRRAREAVGLEYSVSRCNRPIEYQGEYVNLRSPMSVPLLVQGLRQYRRAAVCFYGEPGTGKTELAHHVARELGREVIYKSASDLLSPWVGVTEQKIAEMFSAAEMRCDDVIVLLDEADTFLRDRRHAHWSWESSQTNEFLARMERFSGIFICTTNLVDALDPAVLRRFLLRIEFLSLTTEQCVKMFSAAFGRHPDAWEVNELHRLSGLVPADFANSARQIRFLSASSDIQPLTLLAEELNARRGCAGRPRPIGFIA